MLMHYWLLYLGVPVLFVIGGLMHFVYEWSGNLTLVGIIAPINESVWEHLKLAFWPIMFWWVLGYFYLRKRSRIDPIQWFISFVTAQIVCSLFILTFFYTYTGALGIESLILDISSLFLGLAVAHIFALHIYRFARFNFYWLATACVMLLLLIVAFTVFTFNPPQIPVFRYSLTGSYGVY